MLGKTLWDDTRKNTQDTPYKAPQEMKALVGGRSEKSRVSGLGFRASGFGFGVSGFRFRASGLRFWKSQKSLVTPSGTFWDNTNSHFKNIWIPQTKWFFSGRPHMEYFCVLTILWENIFVIHLDLFMISVVAHTHTHKIIPLFVRISLLLKYNMIINKM